MSVIQKARPGGLPPEDDEEGAWRRPRRRPVLTLLLLVLAAALTTLWCLRARDPLEPTAPPAEESREAPPPLGAAEPPAPAPALAPAPLPEVAPAPEPAPAETLPPRAESDPLARELAGSVSRHPLVLATLKEAGVIDRFVLFVDNLAEGKVPRRELSELRPRGRFLVLGREPDQRIDPASYTRYDGLAHAIGSLDAQAAVSAYRRVAPLCEESYKALGYPEGGFEQRLRTALALLLSTPIVDAEPAVVAETKRYEFADATLESLSDAQKQLLRMGPTNAKRVMAKLRELQAALAAR